ncbi:DUF2924 domain-containing protein [Tardiphaga sp. vice304]|uniref:DUF2924 domain-containing protein n=1 Tax=Tardiphaga sp. vice352 TaxID=2592816 RepID=UPI0034A02C1A
MTNAKHRDPAVEAELDRLPAVPIIQLRGRYRELFRTDPPQAYGPDLLRRSIAQRIQERAYGGLPRPVQRQLDQLIKSYAAKPTGKLVLPPRIKAGSTLVRQWKGKSYRVTVLADGFAFDGQIYGNLSEVAQLITGTRWNGPRFFGLRVKQDVKEPSVRKPPLGGGSDYRKRNVELAEVKIRIKKRRHGL